MKTAHELKANIFKAMAHPNRIRILEALRCNETCNCELGPELGLEQSNLSRHLAILVQAGLIQPRKKGVKAYYRLTDDTVFQILDAVQKIILKQTESQMVAIKQQF
ncbi:MAG: ArsR family transcriptional regulator [Calditrichaeota bacterium]|nr:MAG: ArsR family transcriptional regulator [Calditrichota bacterium]